MDAGTSGGYWLEKGGGAAVRNAFVTSEADTYRKVLHPGLAEFDPLITELANQIYLEWQFLSPKPPPDHLHEAFRRILLKRITDLETSRTPYPIQPTKRRPLGDPPRNHFLNIWPGHFMRIG